MNASFTAESSAVEFTADFLQHERTLACEHGFIRLTFAVYDRSVDRGALAVTDDYDILWDKFLETYGLNHAIAQNICRLGLEEDEFSYGLGRFIA